MCARIPKLPEHVPLETYRYSIPPHTVTVWMHLFNFDTVSMSLPTLISPLESSQLVYDGPGHCWVAHLCHISINILSFGALLIPEVSLGTELGFTNGITHGAGKAISSNNTTNCDLCFTASLVSILALSLCLSLSKHTQQLPRGEIETASCHNRCLLFLWQKNDPNWSVHKKGVFFHHYYFSMQQRKRSKVYSSNRIVIICGLSRTNNGSCFIILFLKTARQWYSCFVMLP